MNMLYRKLKYIAFAAVAALAVSCGPSTYTMSVDLRSASSSGCDFSGKTVALAYVTGQDTADSLFNAAVAEGLAGGLEADYFNSETVIPLFTLPEIQGADYGAKDTLVSLVMDLEADVVVVVDKPVFGRARKVIRDGVETVSVPFVPTFHVYDSMDKSDTVRTYRGGSYYMVDPAYAGGLQAAEFNIKDYFTTDMAEEVGKKFSAGFAPQWEKQSYTFYYYYTDDWIEASSMLVDCRFREAMEKYLELVDKGAGDRRASAAYDMALCCFLLKEYDTALSWLDYADLNCELGLTSWLRQRCLKRGK